MLDPRRMFGSKDTYFFLDCPTISNSKTGTKVNLYEQILIASVALFREFLRHCPEPTPMKWLLVQI